MALNALPILFYNLGGEMLYVLDQRLRAQSIPTDRANKVISDIVSTMFNPQSLKEMMKPQDLYSKQAMRTIFTKLVHSSIMKVNAESMEKLFDLMVMAVKYQFTQCGTPSNILHITLNHFDAILGFVAHSATVSVKVKNVFHSIVEKYGPMSTGEYVIIRQILLAFLQDTNNKVSIYLTEKVQNDDGRFIIRKTGEVPVGSDVPGVIRLFRGEKETVVNFTTGTNYKPHGDLHNVSNEISGKRCTNFGTNIYTNCHSSDYAIASDKSLSGIQTDSHRLAKAELSLLAKLIGSDSPPVDNKEFRLQMFSSSDEMPSSPGLSKAAAQKQNVINITATKYGQEELSRIVDDLTITTSSSSQQTSRGEDLLSLMDL